MYVLVLHDNRQLQTPKKSTTMSDPYKTPAAKKKEDCEGYEDYGLSPPKLPKKRQRTFEEAVKAIKCDSYKIRIEQVGEGKIAWFKKLDSGEEVYLPSDACRILLFLYSRNFMKHKSKDHRKKKVKEMLQRGRVRKAMLQVIKCNGDENLSFRKNYQVHYTRACLTIIRYFQQTGSVGFVPDMSSLTYYLRMQKNGSCCFLQAPCVAIYYLLQARGNAAAPPNASRLIRHL
jgi:hypothetical protein